MGGTVTLNEQGLSAMAKRIDGLLDLLRDEFNRGHRFDSPWDCVESDCPSFRKPCRKSCGCYQDATKAHIAKVLKEIN
jgi:hypothetical protein